MRIPIALLIAALAGPALAQAMTPMERLQLENRLAMERDLARQQSLAAQREAFAADQRARTASTVQSLRAGVGPTALDARIAADSEAIARRQARELAESNARILAIKPASER